jgi:hypothetical protein
MCGSTFLHEKALENYANLGISSRFAIGALFYLGIRHCQIPKIDLVRLQTAQQLPREKAIQLNFFL